jgi:hypothetical protein
MLLTCSACDVDFLPHREHRALLSGGQNWKEARMLVTCSPCDVDFLPHREHGMSNITQINRSVLFREVVYVSCGNHMAR